MQDITSQLPTQFSDCELTGQIFWLADGQELIRRHLQNSQVLLPCRPHES